MKIDEVKKILVVGAGTMGEQIALQCAMHGYAVTIYDIKQSALEAGMATIQQYTVALINAGLLTPLTAEATLIHITPTTDPQAAAQNADILSESVPEDPQLKGRVLAQFNTLCPAHTIFTTNTSSLLPSMFAQASGRPAQLAALHFHTYVWQSNVVDIMPHAGTNPEVVTLLEAFARRIGQIPIILKQESYGYVFNAMLNALNRAAITLAANGVAGVEDIDRAWMAIMKMPIGPMGILDGVGLETAWHITQYWATALGDTQLQTNANFLKQYVDQGNLGVKTGRGFYTYPDPAYAQPDFIEDTGKTA